MPRQIKPVRRTCEFSAEEDRAFEDALRVHAARNGARPAFTYLCKTAIASFCQLQGIAWPIPASRRHSVTT